MASETAHTPQKGSKKKVSSKKRLRRARTGFWIALILFVLPFAVLGWILFSAWMDSGSPVLGNRYENDLDPAITKTELDTILEETSAVSEVESADVQLATGTLRVYADITDSATVDTANSIADQIYTVVTSVLDPSVYFSQHDGEKMYDLEIHVYNYADQDQREEDSFVYVIETKTSSMDAPAKQTMSEPLDAELAEQLRQDVTNRNNPTASAAAEATSTADTQDVPAEGNSSN